LLVEFAIHWNNLGMHPRVPGFVPKESFVQIGAERLYVRDVGQGLPIMVVHGGPDFDHEYLLPEMDRLGDSFRLVYYDQRGRGRSFSGVQPANITMATEVDDLDRIRETFGFESIAVLGHSWGGLVAMEYAIRHPERVSRMILMSTAPASRADAGALRAELARRKSPTQTARMNELRSDPRFQAGDIDTEAEYYRIHFGTTLRNPDHLDAVVRRLRSAFTEDAIVAARAIEDMLYEDTWERNEYDLIPALRRLDIPTLLLSGDYDFVPREVVAHIADAIRGSRVEVLADCGHFAYLEHSEETHEVITAFMTST
jgi:proline iminopeptidase